MKAKGRFLRGKSSRKGFNAPVMRLTAAGMILFHAMAYATPPAPNTLPTGGQAAQGQAAITVSGTKMDVNQSSQKAVLNWQTFNIGADAWVNFNQPNASSATMNRVLTSDPSSLYGRLTATGQVFLLNPAGILFGPTARVDVGGMVASTLKLSDSDFMSGNYRFTASGATGSIVNQGALTASDGGYLALLAPEVKNDGIIAARLGTVAMAAGDQITLDLGGDGLINFTVDKGAVKALIENKNLVQADGGQVLMSAKAAGNLVNAVVNNTGVIRAQGIAVQNGKILLETEAGLVTSSGTIDVSSNQGTGGVIAVTGRLFDNLGSVKADGDTGGEVRIRVQNTLLAGGMSAEGSAGGGSINIEATGRILQTEASRISADNPGGQAGTIRLDAGSEGGLLLSGTISASGDKGGTVQITGGDINLAAASITARGTHGGGTILVGGGYQGKNPDVPNAKSTSVNHETVLDSSATSSGDGGTVVVWSDGATFFTGTAKAKGGDSGGNGGLIEVSGKEGIAFGGRADAAAPGGKAGALLLDPKNITIDQASGAAFSVMELPDPFPAAGDSHGSGSIAELSTGNIVVASPKDDYGATDAGAVFLYNGSTGGLISMLHGSSAGDQVGSTGIVKLSNGNYVVSSPFWSGNRGAATWGTGTAGVSGAVDATNSLVGTTASDYVGSRVLVGEGWEGVPQNGITALSNGNYLVLNSAWNGRRGAVTWGSGTTGVRGEVSADNSLVGSAAYDRVGSDVNANNRITLLPNGNYVVGSPAWSNGAGAATWGNGTTGISGAVAATNSLVGSTGSDGVGSLITALPSGNYVVNSPNWNNGGLRDVGAVTWGSGTEGVKGVISAANSLLGSTEYDTIGNNGITVLTNGNYVVASQNWHGTSSAMGAVTWGSGTDGAKGVVSADNSLVGSSTGDYVGSQITRLANGNYVVLSPNWNGKRGAVTWADGAAGVKGVVSGGNSLVGGNAGDQIGVYGITEVTNSNYVVQSPDWNGKRGAVTWGNGTLGVTGTVSSLNSIVGANLNDRIGYDLTVLTNGNYVLASPNWNSNRGATTWGSGTAALTGTVDASNSLLGSSAGDRVGLFGVTALTNGNYVVASPYWSGNMGAVTWGSGTAALAGTVDASNSLMGSSAGDSIGSYGVTALSNGNYVVASPSWSGNMGAATWGDGTTGLVGTVDAGNSLVGSSANDRVGWVTALTNGNYVVTSPSWSGRKGAVTWGDGTAGVTGAVNADNSLVGSRTNDSVGGDGITALANGNYLVRSQFWYNGSNTAAGAVTWGDGTAGVKGAVSAENSLVGSNANDFVGVKPIIVLPNGNYVVWNPWWGDYKGAVTWGNGTEGVKGVVSTENSLVGTGANDNVGVDGVTVLSNGDYVVRSTIWGGKKGAVTWGSGTEGVKGAVRADNSLVGNAAEDYVGSKAITELSNGRFAVPAPSMSGSTGKVFVVAPGSSAAPDTLNNPVTFGLNPGSDSLFSPAQIEAIADTGTNVILQANNDLTVNSAITINNPAGNGGDLTLQAGRNISFNANVTTDNGILTAIAGDSGALATYKDAGAPNLTIANGVTLDAGTGDIILAANGGTFVNNAGSSALSAGRWLVYSQNPANDIRGGLAYDFKQYDATYGDAVLGGGNGFLYGLAPTVTAGLTGTVTKTYDGTTNATLAPANYTVSGAADGDTIRLNNPTVGTFGTKTAETGKNVTVNGFEISSSNNGAATVYGYRLSSTTAAGDIGAITPKSLRATYTGQNKIYDGTTTATVTGSSGDVIGGDAVTFGQSAVFTDKNAGTGKTINVSGISIGGADAGNYSLANATANTTADISKRDLVVTATGQNKVYDGTTAATATLADNRLTGDALTDSYTNASFNDAAPGKSKPVNVSGISIGGAEAGNYRLTNVTASTTADITKEDETPTVIPPVIDGGSVLVINTYTKTDEATAPVTSIVGALGPGLITMSPETASLSFRPAAPAAAAIRLSVGGEHKGRIAVNELNGELSVSVELMRGKGSLSAEENPAAVRGALAIYSVTGEGVKSEGTFAIKSDSGSVTLVPSAALAVKPATEGSSTQSATFTITTEEGAPLEFNMSQSGNSLYIHPVSEAAQAVLGSIDRKLITATGILAGQDKLGISAGQINAVMIHEKR